MVVEALFSLIFLTSTIVSAVDCIGDDVSWFLQSPPICDETEELEQGAIDRNRVGVATILVQSFIDTNTTQLRPCLLKKDHYIKIYMVFF